MGNILKLQRFFVSVMTLPMIISSIQAEEKIVDLGVFGTTFEIKEEDMLQFLMKRLESFKKLGKLQKIEEIIKERAKDRVINPLPVQGVEETTVEKSFLHDPTLTIDQDIMTLEGGLIAKKNQKINPLRHLSLSKGLLFIDGDNKHHLNWALQHQEKFYVILTNGSPLKLIDKYGIKFYFDQAGIITKRYGIKHIPARIEQEGEILRVTEFKIPSAEKES